MTSSRPPAKAAAGNTGRATTAAIVLLAAGLFLAFAFGQYQEIRRDTESQVQYHLERVSGEVAARLLKPAYGLMGARGLQAAGFSVNRAAFRAYVESRDLPREFPGVGGFGFVQRVMRPDLDAFVAAQRADGAPGFTLRQLTDPSHPDLYVVKFMEPAADNPDTLGLDIGSDPLRRAALQQAIDSGEATLSAPIRLVQNQHQTPGALMLLPVYAQGARPGNAAERRASVIGLQVAPLVMEEVLHDLPDVTAGLFDIKISDTTPGTPDGKPIFDSDKDGERDPRLAPVHRFGAEKSLSLMGREYSLQIKSEAAFDATIDQSTPLLTLACGLVFSALLALHLHRRRIEHDIVEDLVEERTRELEREHFRFEEKDRMLRAVVDNLPALVGYWDKDLRNRFANRAYAPWFGIDPASLPGMHIRDVLGDRLYQQNLPCIEAALRGQYQNFERDIPVPGSEPGARFTLAQYVPDIVAGEVQGFFVMVSDISEVKRQNEKNRQLSDALDQTSECIVITNLQAEIEYVNEAFVRASGYRREELMGSNPRLLHSGKTPKKTYETLWPALGRGETWQGQFHNRRQDGSEFIEHAVISPVRQADGRISHYVAAKRDITQEIADRNELRRAKNAAEAANTAKSQFLATMSHELRTPMNGILGMAQLLAMPEIQDAERMQYAQTILKSGQSLLALLNNILDVSKVEAGRLQLESIAFAPGSILRDTADLFAATAAAKGLQLDVSWQGPAAQSYLGDPHRLQQMLSNLVGNAIKFTAQGFVRLQACEIERQPGHAVLEFSVEDSGIGVALDKQAALFQPFSQADCSTTRKFGGSGLGLSIVRSLAQLMGGEVGVDCVPEQGSRFWFRITTPLSAPDTGTRQSQDCSGMSAGQTTQFDGKVFAVEDNATNRVVILALLTKLGLSVSFAEDGAQAVEAITRGAACDLILMDLQMPVMDGYAATEQIRAWETTQGRPRRPIIALTADAYEEERQRCLIVGMDDVLTKPIFLADLQLALSRWLPDTAKLPVASPAAIAGAMTPDGPQIAQTLRELLPLLRQNKFNALAKLRDLEELVAGTQVAAEIADAGRQLRLMQFDLALDQLTATAKNHDWKI